jgi:CYTH domain
VEGQQHACTGFYTPGKHITQLCSARCDLVASDIRQVLSMLAPQRKAIYAQRNYFFDSPDGRVSKFRRTLRIRFFDDDKAVLTIKVRLGPVTASLGMQCISACRDWQICCVCCTKNGC